MSSAFLALYKCSKSLFKVAEVVNLFFLDKVTPSGYDFGSALKNKKVWKNSHLKL